MKCIVEGKEAGASTLPKIEASIQREPAEKLFTSIISFKIYNDPENESVSAFCVTWANELLASVLCARA